MDACNGKDLAFDVVVKCFFTDPQLRMGRHDLVRGKPLFDKRGDHGRHLLCF